MAPMISEDERQARIDGLRALADWLESTQTAPVAYGPDRFVVPLHTNEAVEEFAADHELTVEYDDEGNARSTIEFGSVVYQVYGYVNFAEHCERGAERQARTWAERQGLEIIRPAADGSAVLV
ncbi:hypothetical protein ACFWY6_39830 [Streptomyces sp. NPDC059037]|uniref:hypothetical protein n=1 Tax=Streptomyces sp. NPDC059037 TaxID=3346710 RepID=UPI0036BB1A1F